MKDFLKIFLVLCAVVSAFFFGRNFGEVTKSESEEIKNLKSENFQNQNAQVELKNLKDKFQKLLDSSDLKKSDEILGKVMTIFLADLSLQISNEKQKDFDQGKKLCSTSNTIIPQNQDTKVNQKSDEKKELESEIAKENQKESLKKNTKNKIKNLAQFKSAEFLVSDAQDTSDIQKALKDLELKKIDSLLDGAAESSYLQSKKFLGTYRGSVIDVTGKVYGTMVMEIKSTPEAKNSLHGNLQLFQDGKERIGNEFSANGLGYSPENYSATVIKFGSNSYIQIYKSESVQKISGLMYERMPNGTSKTIGTFILSRTDLVD